MDANRTTVIRGSAEPVGGKRFKIIVVIGVSGLLISLLLYWTLWSEEQKLIRKEFNHRAVDRMTSITNEFESGIALVRSVSAHFQTSSGVSRENFHAFTKHLFSPETTIHALSWNARVSADELPEHVQSAKAWYPDYTPKQLNRDGTVVDVDVDQTNAESRDFVLVDYIEPLIPNRSAVGFNIASERTRLEALNRARDTGRLSATGGIQLVQETSTQFGVLVFGPIYERGVEIVSVEQRRNHFKGVVVGVYRIGETVEAALSNLGPVGIDVYLFDETSSNAQLLYVHSSRSRRQSNASPEELETLKARAFRELSTTDIGGRTWTLCCTAIPEYVQSRSTWIPLVALSGGLVATLLLIAYLSKLARMTSQLQHHLAQRRETEETLKITQYSIDTSHIPIFWVGPDSRFCYVNEAAAESLGYEPHELCEMKVADIAPIWPIEEWPNSWSQLKKSGSAIFESVHQRKDGSRFPVEIMANYFSYSAQECMFCVATDISDRIRQQECLREHERALAHVSRLSTLGEMVAGIAHEINQPLSAISNFAAACNKEIARSKHEFAVPLEEWTQQIGDQAVRCGDIIRRLRGYVRKSETKRVRVNLNQVVDDSIALIRNDARNRSIQISWDAAQPSPFINADRVQIQQVLVNLLRNANESVSESDSANRQVLVYSRVSQNSVQLIVEDCGQGINEEHIGRLFDAFFTTKPGGLGMGLAISRSIIEAHGGRLWAESIGPRGARFHVELPSIEQAYHGI